MPPRGIGDAACLGVKDGCAGLAPYRLLFDVAARTGLRASELIGLDGRHLALNGSRPHIKVRQRDRNGQMGALKSKHARRDVPIDLDLVGRLRALGRADDEPVSQTRTGTRLHRDNVRNRGIKPCAEEAGASFAGWHTFRHTCASTLFAQGRNVVQVQRWLGHHAPSFTLDTYSTCSRTTSASRWDHYRA